MSWSVLIVDTAEKLIKPALAGPCRRGSAKKVFHLPRPKVNADKELDHFHGCTGRHVETGDDLWTDVMGAGEGVVVARG